MTPRTLVDTATTVADGPLVVGRLGWMVVISDLVAEALCGAEMPVRAAVQKGASTADESLMLLVRNCVSIASWVASNVTASPDSPESCLPFFISRGLTVRVSDVAGAL